MNKKEKLVIGYFADGPWSHYALEKVIADKSLKVGFVVPRIGTKDKTLKQICEREVISYIDNTRINSDEFYAFAKGVGCDLFISMSFDQIFKSAITNLPPLKTINCHAGKLPFYRGRNILNWVLINDESEFGITVHYIDDGIDTGDIILQKVFPITDDDNYKTLLELAYKECGDILYEAIKIIQAGNVKRIEQKDIHAIGFYCGKRIEGDENINWNQSSRDVFNFIRALCKPGPVASSFCKEEIIRINNCRLIPDSPAYRSIVGQIVGKTIQGFIIKTADSVIEIIEFETTAKLRIGDRLA